MKLSKPSASLPMKEIPDFPSTARSSATASTVRDGGTAAPEHTTEDFFPETNWSMVRSAGAGSSAATAALNELCSRYRGPVVKMIPRYGLPADEAEDIAHEYFAALLEKGYLASADRGQGKFRAFIIHDLKLYLNNARRKRQAMKRGGGSAPLSLDQLNEESGFDPAGDDGHGIEDYFDRQWAITTVKQARAALAESYSNRGDGKTFKLLSKGLSDETDQSDYEAWAKELGKSAATVKVAMHRMRDRFRRAIELRVRETVASEEDLQIEIAHLRQTLGKG
jgi:DNA-directed RNA polymerase specialized sigma24 family protein